MVPNLCRTKLLPYILGVIRSSIEDARKAERRLDNQIKQLSDQLTINKLQVTDKLGHLLEKEDVDVLHLSKEIAKDAQRDILMTSVAVGTHANLSPHNRGDRGEILRTKEEYL